MGDLAICINFSEDRAVWLDESRFVSTGEVFEISCRCRKFCLPSDGAEDLERWVKE